VGVSIVSLTESGAFASVLATFVPQAVANRKAPLISNEFILFIFFQPHVINVAAIFILKNKCD
jgi:hypothetical protein